MIFLFSGEGKTDLGAAENPQDGVCPPGRWLPGPMAYLADDIVQHEQCYSPLDSECCYYVSETLLDEIAKSIKRPSLRGKGMNIYHSRGAQALAAVALALGAKLRTPVVAVYFRDCDGSAASASTRHDELYRSMQERGFHVFGLKSGVPMIPKPKSEAWLICALQDAPYQNCGRLEEASGNDDSPNALKKRLKACLATRGLDSSGPLCEVLCDLIRPPVGREKQIDFTRIDMPSFRLFLEDLKRVIRLDDASWKEACDPSLNACVRTVASCLGAV